MATTCGRGAFGGGPPIARPSRSTPLDDGKGGHHIPKLLLWAMKDHCHTRLGHRHDPMTERQLGTGDGAVYLLDVGGRLTTIGRVVGSSPDGSTYCLVGTIDSGQAVRFEAEETTATDVFRAACDFILCSVYDGGEGASNIADVEQFANANDLPAGFLPPHPLIAFSDPL